MRNLHERRRGVFYRGSKAFLHFHEDPAGYFADARIGSDWERFGLGSEAERERLVDAVGQAIIAPAARP